MQLNRYFNLIIGVSLTIGDSYDHFIAFTTKQKEKPHPQPPSVPTALNFPPLRLHQFPSSQAYR